MVCIICPDNCYNSKHQCCSSNNPNHNHCRRKISNPSSHKDCSRSVASRQYESPCARHKKLPCVQKHEHTRNAQHSAADNPFNHSFPLTPLTCSFFFVCTTKKPENLDFQDFPASVTGDERIELPLRVLETPVMPFDQSPMASRYSYFITHFPGNVNDIFEIIQKNEINFYNFQLCRAFSSLCRASSRVLRWQAYARRSIQILTDSAAHPSACGHRCS